MIVYECQIIPRQFPHESKVYAQYAQRRKWSEH